MIDKIIQAIASTYKPSIAPTLIYMLQASEYQVKPYLKWFWRTDNFSVVMHRRTLDKTRRAKALLLLLRGGMLLQVAVALWLLGWGLANHKPGIPQLAVAVFILTPVVWAHLIVLPILIARETIVKPVNKKNVRGSKKLFGGTKAVKIAVAGSYGKTTMKEILLRVLSEGKTVAATPANKNV